jgi:hypothetical protein
MEEISFINNKIIDFNVIFEINWPNLKRVYL